MIITSDNAIHIDPDRIDAVTILDDEHEHCNVLLSSGDRLKVSVDQAIEIRDQWAAWFREIEDDEDDQGNDDEFNDAEITIELPMDQINSQRDIHEIQPVIKRRR